MIKRGIIFLTVLFVLLCENVFSQPKTGAVAGSVFVPSEDGKGRTGISNVYITICSESDTITTVTKPGTVLYQ